MYWLALVEPTEKYIVLGKEKISIVRHVYQVI